jgi:hypothetical protein
VTTMTVVAVVVVLAVTAVLVVNAVNANLTMVSTVVEMAICDSMKVV